ncbi:MAG: discoidin domain-containing protein [Defluviitaleaceae bacterium]|nr:discoidin domain-containing protein [Defluviitaleaceae bacterium]
MLENREVLLRLNMTSNFAPTPFQSSHSSQWSTAFAAWHAFNGNINIGATETGWRSNNASLNEWLQIDFGRQRTLASYSIYRASLAATNAPVNFTFSGS